MKVNRIMMEYANYGLPTIEKKINENIAIHLWFNTFEWGDGTFPFKKIKQIGVEQTNEHVGIDLGVKDFVITSDGEVFENKHFFKKQEKKIAKLQRRLSKKQKGSNNRNKQRVKIAKEFERLTNQKEAYIHSVVNKLLTYYDVVFMEDLNVQGMLKNHKLAKAIAEVGFYMFKQVLTDRRIHRVATEWIDCFFNR